MTDIVPIGLDGQRIYSETDVSIRTILLPVATNAALSQLPTQSIRVGAICNVIADETQSNSPSLYEWNGSAWNKLTGNSPAFTPVNLGFGTSNWDTQNANVVKINSNTAFLYGYFHSLVATNTAPCATLPGGFAGNGAGVVELVHTGPAYSTRGMTISGSTVSLIFHTPFTSVASGDLVYVSLAYLLS